MRSRAESLKKSCPKCGAPPRTPCMGKRGARLASHSERHQVAWEGKYGESRGVRANRCNKPGRVYFIGPQGARLVKIGWTENDPNRRLKQLQTGNGERLCLFGSIAGTQRDEQELHRKFASLRTSGEWFAGEGDLRKLVIELVDAQ